MTLMTLERDLPDDVPRRRARLDHSLITALWLLLLIVLAGCGKSREQKHADAIEKAVAEAKALGEESREAIHAQIEQESLEMRLDFDEVFFKLRRSTRWRLFELRKLSSADLDTLRQAERRIDRALGADDVEYRLAVYKVAEVYNDKIHTDDWLTAVSWLNTTLAYSPSMLVAMYGEK